MSGKKVSIDGLADAEDRDLQMQVLLRSAEYYDAGPLGFGYSDPEAWNNMSELLKEMGMVSEKSDFSAAFSNEFVPEN